MSRGERREDKLGYALAIAWGPRDERKKDIGDDENQAMQDWASVESEGRIEEEEETGNAELLDRNHPLVNYKSGNQNCSKERQVHLQAKVGSSCDLFRADCVRLKHFVP